ncbi:MAG: hypothetical protein LLG42_03595 [Chloroflexi bacterium]|nr:hypothetical protein [Chloroflexota bacterium]
MRSTTTYTRKLTELEQTLQKSLNPVTPNPKFVDELNQRLYTNPNTIGKEKPLTTAYLLMSFGLFIGVFIFWLIRKIVRATRQGNEPQD